MTRMYNPAPPGEIIKEGPPEIPTTVEQFAAQHGIDVDYLRLVTECNAYITPELSYKVARAFGQGPDGGIWFRMQRTYNEWQAAHA
jgi:addiction module HigA family antidote